MSSGLLYEVKAKCLLIEHGFKVSQPLCQNSKYDLIVDNGKSLFKVQIKKTSRKKSINSYRCRISATDRNGKAVRYKKDEVDMFLIYIEPLNMWYVVPYDLTEGKSELTINPTKPVYEAYEDAWILFNDVS